MENFAHFGRCAMIVQARISALNSGTSIKSALTITHMSAVFLSRRARLNEEPEQESNHSYGRCCKTCEHRGEPGAIYICATCYKFSNWEVKK